MSPDLKEKLEVDRKQLRLLLQTHHALLDKCRHSEPNVDELAALAAILHAFYTGLENVFKRISLEIDGHLPQGALWHTEILSAMQVASARRTALLSPELGEKLEEYMDFRHVFRHAYSFQLHWEKMKKMVLGLEAVLDEFEESLAKFSK